MARPTVTILWTALLLLSPGQLLPKETNQASAEPLTSEDAPRASEREKDKRAGEGEAAEGPVFRLDDGGLLRVESDESPLKHRGLKPDQETTLVVRVHHMPAADAIQTLQGILGGSRGATLEGGLRVGQVQGAPKLIFRGKASLVDYALRLLRAVDVPADDEEPERIVRVIKLEHASPQEVVQTLQYFLSRPSPQHRVAGGVRRVLMSSEDYRIKLIADNRTQQIVVETYNPADLEEIQMLVRELDKPVTEGSLRTQIYRMRALNASNTAQLLQQFMGTAGRRPGPRPVQVGAPLIVPHEETNSLLIQAEGEVYEEVMRILSEIDVLPESKPGKLEEKKKDSG